MDNIFIHSQFRYKAYWVLNILIAVLILAMPYYFFEGKLFIGGDDSRLYYSYPDLWIKNIGLFSWFSLSNSGFENPQQFSLPLICVFWFLSIFFKPLVLNNLAFSLPILLGFVYFQRAMNELLPNNSKNNEKKWACLCGAFFYIGSPILWAVSMPIFGYGVWWIGLLPILGYCFIKFYKTNNFLYIFLTAISSFIFSIAFIAVPWFLGILIPICISLILSLPLYSWAHIKNFIKKITIFFIAVASSQIFWALPFLISILPNNESLANLSLSNEVQDTFTFTVLATMRENNIIYPLLNLFHRSIVDNFNWHPLNLIFKNFYSYIYVINSIFFVSVVLGYFSLSKNIFLNKNLLITIYISWIFSLFLYTINIGFLLDFFLLIKFIPGSGMFRNAFDKFSIGYVFLYSMVFSISIYLLFIKLNKLKSYLILLILIVISLNISPNKHLINAPVWGTLNQFKNTNLPSEYLDFLSDIKSKNLSGSVLLLPFNSPAYSIIPDEDSHNIYLGAAPIKLFTGLNNYSGFMSLASEIERKNFYLAVMNEDVNFINNVFNKNSINYFLVQKNIPTEMHKSYIFRDSYIDASDGKEYYLDKFNQKLISILEKNYFSTEITHSKNKNYFIYENKIIYPLVNAKNIHYHKINAINYMIKTNTDFINTIEFNEPFNNGWKMYLWDINVGEKNKLNNLSEPKNIINYLYFWSGLRYLGSSFIKIDNHIKKNDNNGWNINLENKNKDDKVFFIFFYKQFYFYAGCFLTAIFIFFYLFFWMHKKCSLK